MKNISLLAISLLLVACQGGGAAKYSDAYSDKRNTVSMVTMDHSVAFDRSGHPATGQLDALDGFVYQTGITGGDHVTIYVAPTRLHGGEHVAKRLRSSGFLDVAVTAKDMDSSRADIEIHRYVVNRPNCPDWTKPTGTDYQNTHSSNFGCADTTNLGLMVADPRDLVQGTQMTPTDTRTAIRGPRRMRTRDYQDLQTSNTTKDSSKGD